MEILLNIIVTKLWRAVLRLGLKDTEKNKVETLGIKLPVD